MNSLGNGVENKVHRQTNSIDDSRFHEGGHAVAGYLLGFKAKSIEAMHTNYDKRTVEFMSHPLYNAYTKKRANSLAIMLCAGVAAESKASGKPLEEVRSTSGTTDYRKINSIMDKLGICTPEARAAKIAEWEARAASIMANSRNWTAVDAVARELLESEDDDEYVGKEQLNDAIQNALENTPIAGTGYWDYIDLFQRLAA